MEPDAGAPLNSRISRKSGYRFSEKDMRQRMNLERIPIPIGMRSRDERRGAQIRRRDLGSHR